MATVITEECINCGACEPECPNTAIYQGGVEYELDGQMRPGLSDSIFYIVPEKCTECVGFYDQEACAAVCPVDCCIPDPNRPESEEALLERAKILHPEQTFGPDFPSRFKKESAAAPAAGNGGGEGAAAPAPAAAPAAPVPAVAAAPAEAVPPARSLEDWDVPIPCFRCGGEYAVPFRYFRPGVVFYCPHCTGSFVPTGPIYEQIATRLRRFHESWTKSFETFREKRQRELEAFEKRQREALERFETELRQVSRESRPAGVKPKFRWFG